jgi:hypothetical protein
MAVRMMMFENGSTGPVAVCDVCGKPVRDAAGATVFWLREPAFDEQPGHVYDARLVCDGDACWEKAEAGGGNRISTMDLATALVYLLVNVRLAPDGERFEQAVGMAAMLNGLV